MKPRPVIQGAWLAGALLAAALASAAETVTAPTTVPTSPGGAERVEARIADDFASLAGSSANAQSLVTGLRTGTPIMLNEAAASGTAVTIDTPTRPMGYGNISISLGLAREQLASYGITEPTAQQLQAVLTGGTITTASGETVALSGVLTQRAAGMGWGGIAKAQGTTVGQVMSGLKAGRVAGGSAAAITTGAAGTGITTAAGASAAGTRAGHGRHDGGSGYARNASAGSGIVTAAGTRPVTSAGLGAGRSMNAGTGRGAGVVAGSGIVTGSGAAASTHGGGRGAQMGKGHAK